MKKVTYRIDVRGDKKYGYNCTGFVLCVADGRDNAGKEVSTVVAGGFYPAVFMANILAATQAQIGAKETLKIFKEAWQLIDDKPFLCKDCQMPFHRTTRNRFYCDDCATPAARSRRRRAKLAEAKLAEAQE